MSFRSRHLCTISEELTFRLVRTIIRLSWNAFAIQKVKNSIWSDEGESDYDESVIEEVIEEEEEEEVVSVIESSIAEPIIEEPNSETVSQMEVHAHKTLIYTKHTYTINRFFFSKRYFTFFTVLKCFLFLVNTLESNYHFCHTSRRGQYCFLRRHHLQIYFYYFQGHIRQETKRYRQTCPEEGTNFWYYFFKTTHRNRNF